MPYENIGISTSLAPESRSSPTGLVMSLYLLRTCRRDLPSQRRPLIPKMKTLLAPGGLVCDLAFIILSALLSILYVVGFVLALWIAPPLLMMIVWTI